VRSWNSALLTMLGGTEVTRCFLAELQNPTGQLVRLTSHETVKTGGEAATLDFQIPLTDEGPILVEDVRRGAWRGATIVVWIADTATPANRNIIAEGFVGRVDYTDRLDGKIELVTLADALKDVVLVVVQPACPWKFASRQCGASAATWTRAATVTSVTSRRKFTATITSPGALNFTHGRVTWTSGDNDGAQGWVRQWSSGTGLIEMVTDFAFDIEVGNGFDVLAGCKKDRTDCAAYGQINRYGGFDFVAR
jgi:uncharacterized phage protein (TIGR02218 family)